MLCPVAVEPVKTTLSTSGCSASGAPASTPGAGDDVDDAVGHARLGHEVGDQQRGERRLLRGLEHDRAAGGQRRADLPDRGGDRGVPRDDRADDADRLLARVREVLVRQGVVDRPAVERGGEPGVEAQHAGDPALVGAAARQRLAHVQGVGAARSSSQCRSNRSAIRSSSSWRCAGAGPPPRARRKRRARRDRGVDVGRVRTRGRRRAAPAGGRVPGLHGRSGHGVAPTRPPMNIDRHRRRSACAWVSTQVERGMPSSRSRRRAIGPPGDSIGRRRPRLGEQHPRRSAPRGAAVGRAGRSGRRCRRAGGRPAGGRRRRRAARGGPSRAPRRAGRRAPGRSSAPASTAPPCRRSSCSHSWARPGLQHAPASLSCSTSRCCDPLRVRRVARVVERAPGRRAPCRAGGTGCR